MAAGLVFVESVPSMNGTPSVNEAESVDDEASTCHQTGWRAASGKASSIELAVRVGVGLGTRWTVVPAASARVMRQDA